MTGKRLDTREILHNTEKLSSVLNNLTDNSNGYVHPPSHDVSMIDGAMRDTDIEEKINTLVATKSEMKIFSATFPNTMPSKLVIDDDFVVESTCSVDIIPQEDHIGKWDISFIDGSITIISDKQETNEIPITVEIRKASGTISTGGGSGGDNSSDYVHPSTHPVSMITDALSEDQIKILVGTKAEIKIISDKVLANTTDTLVVSDDFIKEEDCVIDVRPQDTFEGVLDASYVDGTLTITSSKLQTKNVPLLIEIRKESSVTVNDGNIDLSNDYVHPPSHPVSIINGATETMIWDATLMKGDTQFYYEDSFLVEDLCDISVRPDSKAKSVWDGTFEDGKMTITVDKAEEEHINFRVIVTKVQVSHKKMITNTVI